LPLPDSFWACAAPTDAATIIKAMNPDTTNLFISSPFLCYASEVSILAARNGHRYTSWSAECGNRIPVHNAYISGLALTRLRISDRCSNRRCLEQQTAFRLSRSRRKITVEQEEDLCLVCGCCKVGWW